MPPNQGEVRRNGAWKDFMLFKLFINKSRHQQLIEHIKGLQKNQLAVN